MLNKTHTKYIQSLHHKKFRDELGEFIAEGPKVVLELLDSREFVCIYIVALENWVLANTKLLQKYPGPQIIPVRDFVLEKISMLSTPNNVLAVFKKKTDAAVAAQNKKVTMVLDGVQDPGNFGTIIRTADWFGVDTVVCSHACADMYNPKVVQSTMGSLARIKIFYTDLELWLRQNPAIKKYAAVLEGTPFTELKKLDEAIIIIGSEGKGITEGVAKLVNNKITIPRIGEAESLNAAVAAGIILAQVC